LPWSQPEKHPILAKPYRLGNPPLKSPPTPLWKRGAKGGFPGGSFPKAEELPSCKELNGKLLVFASSEALFKSSRRLDAPYAMPSPRRSSRPAGPICFHSALHYVECRAALNPTWFRAHLVVQGAFEGCFLLTIPSPVHIIKIGQAGERFRKSQKPPIVGIDPYLGEER
jgi:hypothetical protein